MFSSSTHFSHPHRHARGALELGSITPQPWQHGEAPAMQPCTTTGFAVARRPPAYSTCRRERAWGVGQARMAKVHAQPWLRWHGEAEHATAAVLRPLRLGRGQAEDTDRLRSSPRVRYICWSSRGCSRHGSSMLRTGTAAWTGCGDLFRRVWTSLAEKIEPMSNKEI
jgi:hypothetical protein